MKFPSFWPFGRKPQAPTLIPVPARFIRTDKVGKGELRVRTSLCRLGRAADNDLCLDNDSVSGRHAELYYLPDGTFRICDLDSTNGTWVNGKQVSSQILQSGDVVELGEVRLHFRVGDG